jgi:hypothetical protein
MSPLQLHTGAQHQPHGVIKQPTVSDAVSDVVNDDTWTGGDFEPITSDRVRFLVPSHHLYAAR